MSRSISRVAARSSLILLAVSFNLWAADKSPGENPAESQKLSSNSVW